MTRIKLPNRRQSDTFDYWYNNNRYHVSYTVTDRGIQEIFVHGAKIGSDEDSSLATVAAIISIALQHGVPYSELEQTALKLEDGANADLYGSILTAVRLHAE